MASPAAAATGSVSSSSVDPGMHMSLQASHEAFARRVTDRPAWRFAGGTIVVMSTTFPLYPYVQISPGSTIK